MDNPRIRIIESAAQNPVHNYSESTGPLSVDADVEEKSKVNSARERHVADVGPTADLQALSTSPRSNAARSSPSLCLRGLLPLAIIGNT